MESILIHPENAEQLKAVKAFLKALKVQFESKPNELPFHINQQVEKSIQQYEDGQAISFEEFKKKHFSKK